MKLLPIVLINAVVVAGGIVIYDQVKHEGPATTYESGSGVDPVVLAELQDRLRALEGGAPTLRATGPDPRVMARLDELERRLAVRPPPPPRPGGEDVDAPVGEGFAVPEIGPGEELPAEEISRFRRLMEAAEQQRRDQQDRERLTSALKELEINLNPEQTDKLLFAARDYRRKVGEVYREAFAGARGPDGDRETARESARGAVEGVREEFSVTLHKFLPTGDAQKIVENINRLGGGPRMMGAGGPPRRGR